MASRPRDRRAQIIAAAADQFHRVGYHRVGTADIAAAVGVTAGALYRHFPSKQDLLGEIILDRMERFEAAFARTEAGPIADVIRALTAHGLDYRDLGVLWQRESRHLLAPERDKLRSRGREMGTRLATRIRGERPDLTAHQAELLAWSVFAVVASPSHTTIEIPRPRFDDLLAATASAVIAAPLTRPGAEWTEPARGQLLAQRISRRETLLDRAVDLFARDGFAQVTMEEIGSCVGIAGPSVYNHFSGKQEMLESAITRGTQWLQFLVTQVLGSARTPQEALDGLVRGYTAFALPHSSLVRVLISETPHLPDGPRKATRRAQQEFVADWVELVRGTRPQSDADEVRAVVVAQLTIINDIAQTLHVSRFDVSGDLADICASIQRNVP